MVMHVHGPLHIAFRASMPPYLPLSCSSQGIYTFCAVEELAIVREASPVPDPRASIPTPTLTPPRLLPQRPSARIPSASFLIGIMSLKRSRGSGARLAKPFVGCLATPGPWWIWSAAVGF